MAFDFNKYKSPVSTPTTGQSTFDFSKYKDPGVPRTQPSQPAPSLTPKGAPSFTDWVMDQATAPFKQAGEGVMNFAGGTMDVLGKTAQGDIGGALQGVGRTLGGFGQIATSPMAPAINAGKNLPQFVQDTIQTAQPSFEKTLAGAGQVGRGFQQGNVKDVVYGGAKTLSGGIGTAFSPVGGMMQQLPREIQQGAGVLGQGFSALRGAVPALTGQTGTDTGEFMGDVFDIGMTALPFAGKGIAKAIGKTKTGQAIKEGANMFKQDLTQGYAKNIKPNLERINTAIQKPVGVAFDKFGNIPTQLKKGAGKAGETALTVGYGIMPETQQILKNADKNPYWQAAQKGEYSSQKFLENTAQSLQRRMQDLSNTGKAYNAVRDNAALTIKLPGDVLRDTLREQFKLPVDAQGMVKPSVNAKVILKPADIARIQDVLNTFDEIGGTTMNANQFLNLRQSLDDMAKWEAGVNTGALEGISKQLRRKLDSFAPNEIKSLDALYAPEARELGKIKPYIFDKYGNVKDSAESFLTNLGNRNKSTQFGKLTNSIPDLKLQVDTIKALRNLEDIGNTIGQGSSITNRRLAAGAVGASMGSAVPVVGNIVGGAAGLLLSDPAVAIKAIQGASALKKMFKGTPKSTATGTTKGTFRGAMKQSGQELAGVARDIQKNMSGLKGGFIDTDLLTGKKPKMINKVPEDIITKAKQYTNGQEFYNRGGAIIDKLRGYGVRGQEQVTTWFKNNVPARAKVLDSLNPTGGLFVEYTPKMRASIPLGKNITTLDKTMGKPSSSTITVYRGAPISQKNIVPGDFITTNYDLAKSYAGTGRVLQKKVRLAEVLDDINEPLGEEYLYRPSKN